MAGATKTRKKRGRPALPPEEVKRAPLNMRTTPELRRRLDESAAKSGSSLAQEIEARLSRSYLFEDSLSVTGTDKETAQFIRNLLDAKHLIEQKRGHDAWSDYETWLALRAALVSILEIEEPKKSGRFKKEMVKWKLEEKQLHSEWRKEGGKYGLLASYLDPDSPPPPEYPLSPEQNAINTGHAAAKAIVKKRLEVIEDIIRELNEEIRRKELAEFSSGEPIKEPVEPRK